MFKEAVSHLKDRFRSPESARQESAGSTEQAEVTPDPVFEALLDSPPKRDAFGGYRKTSIHNGRTAWQREQWRDRGHSGTDKIIVEEFHGGEKKYSRDDALQAHALVRKWADNNDFDLDLLHAKAKVQPFARNRGPRKNIFPKTEVIKSMMAGDLKTYDQKELARKGHLTPEEIDNCIERTKQAKAAQVAEKENLPRRLEQAKNSDFFREPLITSVPMTVIESHAGTTSGELEDILPRLPEGIEKQTVRIGWNEKAASQEIKGEEGRWEVEHHSGEMPPDLVRKIIKPGGEASLVLFGGNVRGCMGVTTSNILTGVERQKPRLVDFHIPLEHTYDDGVYDEMRASLSSPFPDKAVTRSGASYLIYEDEELIDASSELVSPVIRLHLWDSIDHMSKVIGMNAQVDKLKTALDKETPPAAEVASGQKSDAPENDR